MRILALDLANNTGVAFGDCNGTPEMHTEVMGPPGASHGQRFTQCLRTTLRLIETLKPQAVVIEAPIVSGVKGGQERSQLAMGYRASVFTAAFIRGVTPYEYPVQTIRKHFIGEGNLSREAAKARVMARCRMLGWTVETDDQSDAAAVFDYARAKLARIQTAAPFGLFDA